MPGIPVEREQVTDPLDEKLPLQALPHLLCEIGRLKLALPLWSPQSPHIDPKKKKAGLEPAFDNLFVVNELGGRDSNPDKQIQSLRSYRWTTSQRSIESTTRKGYHSRVSIFLSIL
jgi:hypothetical protein